MYSSEAILRNNMSSTVTSDNGMLFASTTYKHGLDGDFLKSKDMMMSSDLFQQQQQQSNGGLTRYRSAPSTFFSSFTDGISANNAATSDSSHGEDETETMFSAFMNCGNGSSSNMEVVRDLSEANHQDMQFSPSLKQERVEFDQQNKGFSSGDSQLVYGTSMNGGGGSYGVVMENQMQGRINGIGNCSNNLLRQSSSPAGFFNGFDVMREVGSFRASNVTHGESNSTTNGLNNHINFTPRLSPTSMFMPCIPENGNENTATQNPQNEHKGQVNEANGKSYSPGFANVSWNDSTSSSSLKRNRDGDIKLFSGINGLENQNGDSRNLTSGLIHHLSLPKTSSEMAAVEKYLHFQQDVVPCKIRARRGFATHPRSIAERMRRTRISERMKKLQELFPDMDKTNTADMLDLAVEYIKDLQKQVHTLTDVKAKCTCPSKHSRS